MWICRPLFVFGWLLFILPLPQTAGAQSIYHAWSDHFGDADYQSANAITADGSGNVIVTGEFFGTVDFGGGGLTSAGGSDILVARFDAAGNHLWSKRFGDASYQYGQGIAVDGSGNVLVTGYFSGTVDFGGGVLTSAGSSDIFVAKFDAAGNHLWSKRFGDTNGQYAYCIAADGSGNVIVAGYFYGTVDFGGGGLTSAGSSDIFVAKFDAAGSHLWSQRFGDAYGQSANGVAADGSGNVIVTGDFYGTVDFGGGGLTSAGSSDIFIAKFDATGSHLWSQRFGDANGQYPQSITADASGNVVAAGYFEGTVDFGGGPLPSAGLCDIFVAKFDAAGSHLWSERFGDADDQYGYAITTDGSGNISTTGEFEGTVDFGGGPLTSAGGSDIFIAKFWRAAPEIAAIRDIPGDQGGWVNLCWDASGIDTPAEHLITHYTLWRAIQPSLVSSMVAGGASLVSDPLSVGTTEEARRPLIRLQRLGSATYYWYFVGSVDAYYLPGYSAPAPTLFDSTAVCTEYHYFQVIAHTSDPYTFYTSAPDSGYSVDNLAPAAPMCLAGEQSISPEGLSLSWRANDEADLACYAVYRGLSAEFVPGPGNRIASPEDTTSFDGEWRWDSGYYYKVSAVDVHGNESGYALLGPEDVTGVGDSAAPRASFLAQNYPNPFRRSTRIVFRLEESSDVSLKVYDVSGRLVRVLVEGSRDARTYQVEWDATDTRGERVASGVYFYHLTTAGRTYIRKAVLLR